MGMAQAAVSQEPKILVVGDPHAKKSNVPEMGALTAAIVKEAIERKVDAIVILGDLANDFAKMHLQAWNSIVWMLKKLSEIAPVIYIVGNHDAINNQIFQSDDHFFNAFKYWNLKVNPILIVDKPMLFKVKHCKFMGIPYVPPGRFNECFEGFEHHDDLRAVFCHQEFRGAKMGAIESKDGDIYSESRPLAISGHVHDRQQLQDNLIYVGEPRDSSFGNTTKRTISLFKFKTDSSHEETLIDLGLPKKITIKMSVDEAKVWKPEENTKYRIYIEDTTETISKFKRTKKYKELLSAGKVIPKPTDKIVARRNVENHGYVDLLRKSIEEESPIVKDTFQEVMNAIGQG